MYISYHSSEILEVSRQELGDSAAMSRNNSEFIEEAAPDYLTWLCQFFCPCGLRRAGADKELWLQSIWRRKSEQPTVHL
jgi:hypothetical protein